MSTFDGYVKEFPNIRIDSFRTHPGKPPPAACFLSHVHSDHLLGLESLKMPFVYCSATTRRLLLRLEKYPHRINFAKGILESRKQHYRHLRLVLRALPLHTSTELELGPKCRLRVTLIDANHCPGSVMFLIEDESKAILYTGDIRAEPWWVNSIIQNPFLLPYTCGLKLLDCIYLDTTFSTHEDSYRHFPTKADGLKELLSKVAKFPNDTQFYFRAWTLGYEQVWMALSHFLGSPIHVDSYQMQLFTGIMENGRDGFSMFEGPALVGFPVGNHIHPGCLTEDATQTRLHSCEPGMPCHAKLSKSNVVWITPIVSRLDDGTELLELGAGGGFGDLQQTFELEVNDVSTLEALQLLCRETLKDERIMQEIELALKTMQKSGSLRVSLNGLGLEGKDETSLKEFVDLVSKRGGLFSGKSENEKSTTEARTAKTKTDRIIHFPFSRHSSYEELRHFVSVFRPKDICPCTVDLDNWTQEMSMESLFGDLCSEPLFFHDKEIELEVEDIKSQEERQKQVHRKRQDDSQSQAQVMDTSDEMEFQSARASLKRSLEQADGHLAPGADTISVEDSISQRPLLAPVGSKTQTKVLTQEYERNRKEVEEIRAAFLALNGGKEVISKGSISTMDPKGDVANTHDSQHSFALSEYDSQLHCQKDDDRKLQLDGAQDSDCVPATGERDESRRLRLSARQEANRAARKALWQDETGHWNDLNLRCLGRVDHTEEEIEL